MIFVSVGTHEQPFNRLVKYMDKLKLDGIIEEDVIIQTGYSTYVPKKCMWRQFFPYNEMKKNVETARIVITHGGPSSFIMPLQIGKIPIVVPRRYEFKEHVNAHQVEFSKAVAERMGTIILVTEIDELKDIIFNYSEIIMNMPSRLQSNNKEFNQRLNDLVKEIL